MHIFKSTKRISQVVLDIILPPKCMSCSCVVNQHGNLCPECWDNLSYIGKHKCHICGLPFEFDMGEKAICPACTNDKPEFKKAVAVCKYEGAGRKIAIKLKFGDSTNLAPYMAKMMSTAGRDLISECEIIAPVPLHYRRKLKRKYNQASMLALNIAKITGKAYAPKLLKRVKATKQQTKLSKKARKENVQDAFAAANMDIKGKKVLLVDDVMTTGATMSECAKALKTAGAKKVCCVVFARVVAEKG